MGFFFFLSTTRWVNARALSKIPAKLFFFFQIFLDASLILVYRVHTHTDREKTGCTVQKSARSLTLCYILHDGSLLQCRREKTAALCSVRSSHSSRKSAARRRPATLHRNRTNVFPISLTHHPNRLPTVVSWAGANSFCCCCLNSTRSAQSLKV